MTEDQETIYLAGFMDGEGSISTDSGVVRVSAGQIDPRPLRLLHRRYGGQLRLVAKSSKNPRHRDIYLWNVAAKSAVPVLVDLLPYLIVKQSQARVALQLQSRMRH